MLDGQVKLKDDNQRNVNLILFMLRLYQKPRGEFFYSADKYSQLYADKFSHLGMITDKVTSGISIFRIMLYRFGFVIFNALGFEIFFIIVINK